jgi:hypothetical protein
MSRRSASSERRQSELVESYRCLATALILDRRPRDTDLIALTMTIVEAALSGDRVQLAVAFRALKRLARYVPQDKEFSEEMRSYFWTMGGACVSAWIFLELEFESTS